MSGLSRFLRAMVTGPDGKFEPLQEGNVSDDQVSADGELNGHGYVDLGLSVKWATCNLGAPSPSDHGEHYAWGETGSKSEYNDGDNAMEDGLVEDISGDSRCDAARAEWGDTWRLPTKSECEELVNNCQCEWMTLNGREGYKITGRNGKSIFLPAAGYRYGRVLFSAGSDGNYWCSTPINDP